MIIDLSYELFVGLQTLREEGLSLRQLRNLRSPRGCRGAEEFGPPSHDSRLPFNKGAGGDRNHQMIGMKWKKDGE